MQMLHFYIRFFHLKFMNNTEGGMCIKTNTYTLLAKTSFNVVLQNKQQHITYFLK